MSSASRRLAMVTSPFGLHLRAASRFVQLSQRYQADVRVVCNGLAADGRSVLDLITLGAGCGAELEVEATGRDAEQVIAALCALIEDGFREGEAGPDEFPT